MISFKLVQLVEMRGVEPLSENIAIGLSPSAAANLDFASLTPSGRLRGRYLDEFPLSASENWLTGIPLFASFPFPWEEDRKDVSIKLLKRNQFLRLL